MEGGRGVGGVFHLNFHGVAHMLHFLLFVGVFQMINDQMSDFLSLISQHHPSFLSEMTGLLLLLLFH